MNPSSQISPSSIRLQGLSPTSESRTLGSVLASIMPLPSSALFIGVAEDGLPVLLNLCDPALSPVLITADAGAGKTRLLQTVARGIEQMHDPAHVRYVVITEHPEEWRGFEGSRHSDGTLAFHHAITSGYLHSTALHASLTTLARRTLVLLIDGLEALFTDGDLRHAVHSILRSPPSPRVLALATVGSSSTSMPPAWLDAFRVQLYGYVRNQRLGELSDQSSNGVPADLQPPCQFATCKGSAWLPFWLPELD